MGDLLTSGRQFEMQSLCMENVRGLSFRGCSMKAAKARPAGSGEEA